MPIQNNAFDFNIKDDEAHIWVINITRQTLLSNPLNEILSSDEIIRSEQFVFLNDRLHFINTHIYLRVVLAKYLNLLPRDISFITNNFGKPFLSYIYNQNNISFNISHSNNLMLIGVLKDALIGVDIEYHKENIDYYSTAQSILTPREFEKLTHLSTDSQKQEFFKLWTYKEAFVKAIGKGMSIDFKSFSITLEDDNTAKIFDFDNTWDKNQIPTSQLTAISTQLNYSAAVAIISPIKRKLVINTLGE